MNGGDARPLEIKLKAQVKIWRVDTDKNRRRVLQKMALEFAPYTGNFRVVAQHFNIAAHGEFFHREQGLNARSDHARPCDAFELKISPSRLERRNQMRTE